MTEKEFLKNKYESVQHNKLLNHIGRLGT